MKKQDTYGEPTVLEYPNAIIRVYRPTNLSDEEQARRMKQVYKAAEELLKDQKKGGR